MIPERVRKSTEGSLKKLKVDYFDLMLIHSPVCPSVCLISVLGLSYNLPLNRVMSFMLRPCVPYSAHLLRKAGDVMLVYSIHLIGVPY